MIRKTGTYAVMLVFLLAAGCAPQSKTTGEAAPEEQPEAVMDPNEGSMEDSNAMEDPLAVEEAETEMMEEPAAPAAPAPKPSTAPPAPAPSSQSVPVSREAPPPVQPSPPPAVPMIEIPAGTTMHLELKTDLSSATNLVGDEFKGRLLEPVTMGGQVMVPAQSRIWGTVTEAVSAKKMSGQAHLSLAFERLEMPDGTFYDIQASLTEEGVKVGKRSGAIIGGSAAGGALLGKILGKNTKGAVKGALIGAAIGTGIAAAQKGQDLELPKGTEMEIVLETPLSLPEPS